MALRDYRLNNLPRSAQILIFGALILCLGGIFYLYNLKDLIKERDALQAEIAKLEIVVAQGTAIESRLSLFKQELSRLEERLAELQKILPPDKETPEVLRSMQQMAASSNLTITKFVPKPLLPRVFYSEWPITIDVAGNYNGLGMFFEKIGQAARITNIETISINGIENSTDPSKTLTASCTATTFVYKEAQETPAVKQEKKR